MRHKITDSDLSEAMKPENIRVAISIKVPLDVLDFFKTRAEQSGIPYQTQINHLLRDHVDAQQSGPGDAGDLRADARSAQSAVDRLLQTLKRIDQRSSR
jgi:hypothetical protein